MNKWPFPKRDEEGNIIMPIKEEQPLQTPFDLSKCEEALF